MKKAKYWPGWVVIFSVLVGCVFDFGLSGSSIEEHSSRRRADIIKIDSLVAYGDLEKSPVEFLHDKHTDAMAKKNMDCTACHLKLNGQIYPKFKRIEDTGRIEAMNVYHEGCISCHGKMNIEKEKTGPIACDDCHRKKNQYTSSRQPMGLDKSLHFRHLEASENKCQRCHHEYNEAEKKLTYTEGHEGTCRYCHGKETKENRISMRLASHIACINCHLKTKPEKTIRPPVNCSGCHEAAFQKKIKKATMVPRIKRNQPDTVLLKAVSEDLLTDKSVSRMNFVPFNHKAHENSNETCRGCHHASLKSCKECHTLNGSTQGEGVSLEKAAHKPGSKRSCLGCHEQIKHTEKCVGCHLMMGRNRRMPDASCLTCHAVPISEIGLSSDPDHEKRIVESILQSKNRITETYSAEDIPERVTINRLSSQYEPVDFPHKKVVTALIENMKDDKLASYFHNREGTICQGCHHYSPRSSRPPNCGNCHVKLWDQDNPSKPGILGAYHQQCLGCHTAMKIEKPIGCTECHKEKISSN